MSDNRLDAVLIIGLLVLLAAVLGVLSFVAIPKENMTLFAALSSGVVGASVAAYVGYRWGSSKGSASKDVTIATMAANAGPSLDPTQPPLKVPTQA